MNLRDLILKKETPYAIYPDRGDIYYVKHPSRGDVFASGSLEAMESVARLFFDEPFVIGTEAEAILRDVDDKERLFSESLEEIFMDEILIHGIHDL